MLTHPQLHHHGLSVSRKPSIVELLSSPPPLPTENHHNPSDDFSLSRNTSVSSKSSSLLQQSMTASDWNDILLADLTESNKLVAINSSYSVQKAFETLISHDLTSLPVALSKNNFDLSNCLLFDYSDLNTYLLLIMNKVNFNDLSVNGITDENGGPLTLAQKQERFVALVNKAKKGEEVPVDFIVKLHPKNPFLKFKESETLLKAVEAFGNGAHRVAIIDSHNKITGILSQRRAIRFFWENARRFPSLEFLWNTPLAELKIGSTNPITIQGDLPLIEALQKMFNENVSSLAVIDKNKSLVGNISIVDVKNVSSTKNSHLLFKPVTTFILYNLSQKGIEKGQDQFPIFHVSQQTSLGRVIAKLVATQSHRLWIVESRTSTHFPSSSSSTVPSTVEMALSSEAAAAAASSATSVQPEGRPGKLIGVVTLTDILGLFAAHKSGIKIDPQMSRNNRRRSSTLTTRSSLDAGTGSAGLGVSTPSTPQSTLINQEIFRKSYQTGKPDNVFSNE